jgi:dTDP-4-amino-4,6-dideoxygalactose transaminase
MSPFHYVSAGPSIMHIPFNKPYLTGQETAGLERAFRNLRFAGDGPFTLECARLIEKILGCPRALLTTSCTHALEMAALLLDIKAGDEIIAPSFTFVSTVNAFVLRGAKPVFIDIRPDTLNFDDRQFESLLTSSTRAAIPVHYAGVACEMDSILETAARRGVAVVEDNAHGLGGSYKGRLLGVLGCLAAQSFHETKNFSCGEGGALIVNRRDLIERAEIIREKGTNRSRFFRGEVDKYTWVDVGSSYVLGDLLAAFLLAQLEERESIQARRKALWDYYCANLKGLSASHGVGLPFVPPHCSQAYHMFYLITRSLVERTALIRYLKERDIHAVFHYVPLHLSGMGQHFGGRPGQCPVTEEISERLLRLPFYNAMTREEQDVVISEILSFYGA